MAVIAQPKFRPITVKTGTLVDNINITSASEEDKEAHWVKHKGKRAVHDFEGSYRGR